MGDFRGGVVWKNCCGWDGAVQPDSAWLVTGMAPTMSLRDSRRPDWTYRARIRVARSEDSDPAAAARGPRGSAPDVRPLGTGHPPRRVP